MSDSFSNVEQHKHDGMDAPRLNPRYFKGFQILNTAPTHKAEEGTLILANESGTYKLYARINGGWRTVTLT